MFIKIQPLCCLSVNFADGFLPVCKYTMFYIYIYCWQCSCGKRKKKDGDLTLHTFTHFTEMSEGLLRKLITGRLRDDIQLVESANAKEFLGKYQKKITDNIMKCWI